MFIISYQLNTRGGEKMPRFAAIATTGAKICSVKSENEKKAREKIKELIKPYPSMLKIWRNNDWRVVVLQEG